MIKLLIKYTRSIFVVFFSIIIILFLISKINDKQNLNFKQDVNNVFVKFYQPVLNFNFSNENKILVIARSKKSEQISDLIKILQWSRFTFNLVKINSLIDRKFVFSNLKLSNEFKSFYSVVVFESEDFFKSIYDQIFIDYLINTARKFKIGFIFLDNNPNFNIKYCKLNVNVKYFFKITKFKSETNFLLKSFSNERQFTQEKIKYTIPVLLCDSNIKPILKNRHPDSVRFVIMKIKLNNILSSLILDIIEYCSYDRLSLGLERMIQIDIDDVFVGTSGLRLKPTDVHSLIEFQNYLNNNFFNLSNDKFKFNLGFSGFHYCSGSYYENLGDQLLIDKKNYFNWFDHTWSHLKSQQLNSTQLKQQLFYNFDFAQQNCLPTDTFYSVSPHHSGIYPVSKNLFDLWSNIWMIKVTSTEEYPHLRPSHLRRGFVYKNIMVLPRQTCGIFTHTNFFSGYPKGIQSLYSKIYGGEIFRTVLFNRINIFMTHMTNYANDRLALFVFKNLFNFISQRTNLKFIFKSPILLAKDYFKFHSNEIEPIWTNPCDDKHQLAIWQLNQSCHNLPKLIILGPQKTGTTAIYHFLNAHPSFSSNKNTQHYEETQFFVSEYYNGIDWYLSLFDSNSSIINFEKSANYFSDAKAAYRIKKLLPNSKFIIIIIDPIDRAYSWYQHMKFQKDSVAIKYTFYDILTFSSQNETKNIEKFRKKCLDPGVYIKHLLNWFKFFNRNQFLIIDGNQLKQTPYLVMNSIQTFMNSSNFINYTKLLVYNPKKKFFCLRKLQRITKRCLGPSKGRNYSKIDKDSFNYLRVFYHKYNIQLVNFLIKNRFNLPNWLQNYI